MNSEVCFRAICGAAGEFVGEVGGIAVVVDVEVDQHHGLVESLGTEARLGPGDVADDLFDTRCGFIGLPGGFFLSDAGEGSHEWHVGAAAEGFGGLLEEEVFGSEHFLFRFQ